MWGFFERGIKGTGGKRVFYCCLPFPFNINFRAKGASKFFLFTSDKRPKWPRCVVWSFVSSFKSTFFLDFMTILILHNSYFFYFLFIRVWNEFSLTWLNFGSLQSAICCQRQIDSKWCLKTKSETIFQAVKIAWNVSLRQANINMLLLHIAYKIVNDTHQCG